ncbi:MAG: RNA degradosome polyphosphate kinase [Lachnospiraceae bacterium]|nr:RNA degradosome polyphosphate kinase [Lachnospiraceae bacterium]
MKKDETAKNKKNTVSKDFRSPEYYTNRELSWMRFDQRILGLAEREDIPLFERLKFLSIVSSNLDEFVMVRVGSLVDMIHEDIKTKDIAGMTAQEQLIVVTDEIHELVTKQYRVYNKELLPLLEENGLTIVGDYDDLTADEKRFAGQYFEDTVYPVLTPLAIDPSHPFPLIKNHAINIGVIIKKGAEEEQYATVQVPSVLPRVVVLPAGKRVIFLEEIILHNLSRLFEGYTIVTASAYRITRNGDVSIDEDDTSDLLHEIEESIRQRQRGETLRLEKASGMDKRLLSFLTERLGVEKSEVYNINGPLDLTVCMKLYSLQGFDDLKAGKFVPQPAPEFMSDESEEADIFECIRKGDILLHHPYQSFDPIVEFIKRAATDPNVLAIKQTLYRVSGNSPIIAALARAAENGKQVTVLVELKARFDEEHNIVWARMLEKAGCHVIYGLMGLKTHSKITLVVRMEEDGIRRYIHLGTGNYNDATAKIYTDIGMLTCREAIGEDATAVFNMLSGYSEPDRWNALSVAPYWLKDRMLYLIEREAENARAGKKSGIMAKMNSLSDPDIIEALYKASNAGVKIDLIVRGICCLKVGIEGVSENISVRSIVGNFLEHARIFCFNNDDKPEVYCGSADWMPRNLDRRVEIVFPVTEPALKERLIGILETQLKDNVGAYELTADSRDYVRVSRGRGKRISSQEAFVEAAKQMAEAEKEEDKGGRRRFKPLKK